MSTENYYRRKLFALLHDPQLKGLYKNKNGKGPWESFDCLKSDSDIETWWDIKHGKGVQADHIGATSDRMTLSNDKDLYLNRKQEAGKTTLEVRHPISGQEHNLEFAGVYTDEQLKELEEKAIKDLPPGAFDPRKTSAEAAFWWCWRFLPEVITDKIGNPQALLLPAETRIPDCPIHSHNSTVSALTGALFPETWTSGDHAHPYLLIFTFSPVQEFVKSSRKFLDFWAGSYLLHYLSARLCWYLAKEYGPDAVITPALWGQEIIDAFIRTENYLELGKHFASQSTEAATSLRIAGFPNVITVLVADKAGAEALGKKLTEQLLSEWTTIGYKVRAAIKKEVHTAIQNRGEAIWQQIAADFGDNTPDNPAKLELLGWGKGDGGQWEWNRLWDAQLAGTWESYWTAVPLGDPDQTLDISKKSQGYDQDWINAQKNLAHARTDLPTAAEQAAYRYLNIGTWWGSLQSRLGQLIQAVKNTRTWALPVAPGERSTVSGQYSAAHPRLLYSDTFREGGGLPASSQRLFWRVMSEVFPGLFNGSEKLNCIELTKRMAWVHGGIGEALGMPSQLSSGRINYEDFIRFPNLSSIAAARFAYTHPQQVKAYWEKLKGLIENEPQLSVQDFKHTTRKPFQIPKTDQELKLKIKDFGEGYNGVMFSSKWLADDLGIEESTTLRKLVNQAHQETGITNGSPGDWWVILLGDGDNMGKYVNGSRLKTYQHYLATETRQELAKRGGAWTDLLENTNKRMGPATHVGLNRALLDFSNRLVPYLTQERFCGRVVYSGGDDVMAILPLEDLPEYLRSLRAAWSGAKDPDAEFDAKGGYWYPKQKLASLPDRPLFTMGEGATMSLGIIVAHKSIPLPTVLENLWAAEKERAKKLTGVGKNTEPNYIPPKDGLCFRVIYSSGNTLEALMKGHLLEPWWAFIQLASKADCAPLLHRLAEELPRRCVVTSDLKLFNRAALVILNRRDQKLNDDLQTALLSWLDAWETWAWGTYWQKLEAWTLAGEPKDKKPELPRGVQPDDLAKLLRFSAFWLDKGRWAKAPSSEESL